MEAWDRNCQDPGGRFVFTHKEETSEEGSPVRSELQRTHEISHLIRENIDFKCLTKCRVLTLASKIAEIYYCALNIDGNQQMLGNTKTYKHIRQISQGSYPAWYR